MICMRDPKAGAVVVQIRAAARLALVVNFSVHDAAKFAARLILEGQK